MQLFNTLKDRVPMVWVLLGLLFNAAGLYLGFDYSLSFVYLAVGWFCCVLGGVVYLLQRQERPRQTRATRLSSNFISAGATVMMPAMPKSEGEPASD
jgi:hypothetical protein